MRIVLDTAVLITALRSANGAAAEIVDLILHGNIVLLMDLENIAEPILVLTRYRPMSSDPDDDMVLDVAINGHATAIITNNVKHLRRPAGNFGIEVFTPFELLEKLRKESGNDT